jgi:hypothetical protein
MTNTTFPARRIDGANRYVAFGMHIASALPLPELPIDRFGQAADLEFYLARLPVLDSGVRSGSLQVCGDDAFLTVENVARYRIRAGREIAIDPCPGVSDRSVRLSLLGSAFGVLCHQRGLLPLHANAIVSEGRAFVFAGRAGIGKSTLAAHFQSRGYEVLCDDVCVVSFDDRGRPLAWPGLPCLKLWRDAAEMFGHDSRKLELTMDGRDKFLVPLAAEPAPGPFPLAHLYILMDCEPGGEAKILPLSGITALEAVLANVYRRWHLKTLGLVQENFRSAALVATHASVYAAQRCRGFDVFAQEAARLETHFLTKSDATNHAIGGARLITVLERTMTP